MEYEGGRGRKIFIGERMFSTGAAVSNKLLMYADFA